MAEQWIPFTSGPRFMKREAYAGREFEEIVESPEFRRHFNYDRTICFCIGAALGIATYYYAGLPGL